MFWDYLSTSFPLEYGFAFTPPITSLSNVVEA
nr:MAG TPA: hypothetical protein [Caudoviricetes sp.]